MPLRPSRRGFLAASSAVVAGCGRTSFFDYEDLGRVDGWSVWPKTLPEWLDHPVIGPVANWEGSEDDVNNIGDPIILTASTVLAPGAVGSPNLASLSNPYGLPMELLEVRFSVAPTDTDITSFRAITGLGIGVKMDLGSIPVVDVDVPLSCFGSYRDCSKPVDPYNVASTTDASQWLPDPNVAVPNNVNTYWWRLKYPLYIPGGTTLNASFHHMSQEPVDAKVWVTYHCRVRPKGYKPNKLMVPWVCSFNSKAFNVVSEAPADSDESSELDLVNSFSEPLEVTRLVGSFSSILTAAGQATVNTASEVVNIPQPREYTYVTARTSQGDDVIFNQTPWEALWPTAWRTWDMPDGTLFSPGEWLKVTLTRPSIDYVPDAAAAVGRVQFAVSMVGYREVGSSGLASSVGVP